MDVAYLELQCSYYFPTLELSTKSVETVNAYTGGWDVTNTTRLMYANGEFDPWRPATVSSELRPGGPLESTEQLPVRLVEGGVHCSDLYGQNWAVNEGVKAIADAEVAQMAEWVAEFYTQKGYKNKREISWEG